MADRGIGRRTLAAVSANVLRSVGVVTVLLAGVVTAATLTTPFTPDDSTGGAAAMLATEADAVAAVLEFSLAHPAYPAAMLFGLVLIGMGEDMPLLGG